MQATLGLVVILVVIALLFDFMNGFHDAANSIATVVSTGVLKPTTAVVFAAVFNLIAYFVFGLNVAATVGKGIVETSVVDTGMPSAVARNSVRAPPVSAQKPPTGFSLVIFWPMVRTMRQPPNIVPPAIAA